MFVLDLTSIDINKRLNERLYDMSLQENEGPYHLQKHAIIISNRDGEYMAQCSCGDYMDGEFEDDVKIWANNHIFHVRNRSNNA